MIWIRTDEQERKKEREERKRTDMLMGLNEVLRSF